MCNLTVSWHVWVAILMWITALVLVLIQTDSQDTEEDID